MNKLQMVQNIILTEVRRVGVCSIDDDKLQEAWNIADKIQVEADKRENIQAQETECNHESYGSVKGCDRYMCKKCNKVIDVKTNSCVEKEWQPDWSQAPDCYDWFCVGSDTNNGYFCNIEPKTFKDKYWFVGEDSIEIINHGYTGDWRKSLRKRPQ